MRSFAEALRRALRAPVRADMEVATFAPPDVTVSDEMTAPASVSSGDGVLVTPTPITAGELLRVWYGGLLAKAGARQVFLHWGVGPGAWQGGGDVAMEEVSPGIWACSLEAAAGGRFEFCFRDDTYNWDNNSGRNWSYTIHNGLVQ